MISLQMSIQQVVRSIRLLASSRILEYVGIYPSIGKYILPWTVWCPVASELGNWLILKDASAYRPAEGG
jgi:hypothetical protein